MRFDTHTHRRLCALFALEREFAAIFYDAFDFVIFEFVLSNLLAKKVYLYLLSCVFIVFLSGYNYYIYSHNSTIDKLRVER